MYSDTSLGPESRVGLCERDLGERLGRSASAFAPSLSTLTLCESMGEEMRIFTVLCFSWRVLPGSESSHRQFSAEVGLRSCSPAIIV